MIENRVLKRQLKKLNINSIEDLTQEKYQRLLDLIEFTYEDMDKNVYRLERALDISTTELKDFNDNLEIKIQEEVKKNREKDEKLLNQARFASMGEMIGNIAHQWRQPLSAISSKASGMLLQLAIDNAPPEDIEKSYKDIIGYTEFLSQTIDDFRNFLKENCDIKSFKINDVILKTLNLVSASYQDNKINIKYFNTLENASLYTKGCSSELAQVFLNIFNNARDASISTNPIGERKLYIGYESTPCNHIIFIQDNAKGIASDVINKIFDPYFTTKHQKQGTGIGLYMSKKIIASVEGEIYVENRAEIIDGEMYDGARFFIKLSKIK